METSKINEIYPVHAFYTVSVAIESEPDDKGKSKKSKETYLVDAEDVSGAEAKTISLMECVNGTWEIESVAKAKISGVVTEAQNTRQ